MAGKTKKEEYGELVSVEITDASRPDENQNATEDISFVGEQAVGNLLWEYQKEGRIGGVPVEDDCKGLDVNTDEMLQAVFMLKSRPRLLLETLLPGKPESRTAYDELMEKVYNGEARIVDETRQYDQNLGGYVVWVRYDEITYALHPRFKYLKDER